MTDEHLREFAATGEDLYLADVLDGRRRSA
jgi:hypothetical protein